MTVHDTARALTQAGISVIPIRSDGSKAPAVRWSQYQEKIADEQTLKRWFGNGTDHYGFAAVAGEVSGGLECIDFDAPELASEWGDLVEAEDGGAELLRRLTITQTPRGGWHVVYRCQSIEGNQKLAQALGSDGRPKTLIETRGRAGYFLLPGSPARCHETGKKYRLRQGDLLDIPAITAEEREILLRAARSFDQLPKRIEDGGRQSPNDNGNRPGDDFEVRATWEEILEPAGWRKFRVRPDGGIEWTRPEKSQGASATTGYCKAPDGRDLLHVFSSNSHPFEPGTSYGKFAAFALLNHGGNFAAAAHELGNKGFGIRIEAAQSGGEGKEPPRGGWRDTTATIEAAIAKLGEDVGAVFEAEVIEALKRARASSAADYQRYRKRIKDAGASVGELDRLVCGGSSYAEDDKNSKPLEVSVIEPWPEKVDGATLLTEIAATFVRYLVLPKHAQNAMAPWCAHAHAFHAFEHSPRLNLRSPRPRCGKTLARDLIGLFVPKPLNTENLSTAVLFRVAHKHAPTFLVDEYDTFIRDNENLRGALNAGHKRGGMFYRCEGDNHEPTGYSVFAPTLLAGINQLPGTLHDRSIVITLSRATKAEMAQKERFDTRKLDCHNELNRKLARWVADHLCELERLEPKLPTELFSRAADNWRPIFAIAQIAGGEWPKLVVDAYFTLRSDDTDTESSSIQLFEDIRKGFGEREAFFSQQLVGYLHGLEDRSWAEWGRAKKPITKTGVARLLSPFKIKPSDIHIEDTHAKGYELTQFADVFARYLPDTSDVLTPK